MLDVQAVAGAVGCSKWVVVAEIDGADLAGIADGLAVFVGVNAAEAVAVVVGIAGTVVAVSAGVEALRVVDEHEDCI